MLVLDIDDQNAMHVFASKGTQDSNSHKIKSVKHIQIVDLKNKVISDSHN